MLVLPGSDTEPAGQERHTSHIGPTWRDRPASGQIRSLEIVVFPVMRSECYSDKPGQTQLTSESQR